MKAALLLSLTTLFLTCSCKLLPPIEICKIDFTGLNPVCKCKIRNMTTGETLTGITIKDVEYCDRGVIIAVNSWADLDSYLLKVRKTRRARRIARRSKYNK